MHQQSRHTARLWFAFGQDVYEYRIPLPPSIAGQRIYRRVDDDVRLADPHQS